MPGDAWEIVPARASIGIDIDRLVAPAYRMRTFSGSGGFGGKTPPDPDMKVQARWTTWQRRNRFGGEFMVSGHAGEAFNQRNKAVLEQHPEYLAEINGQRVPWSIIAKPCVSNPEVVKLWVADRLEDYRRRRKLNPDEPHSFAVSVEPADGGGHCECEQCRKIGSISNRVFTLANATAKAVAAEFPDGHVSLFAYHVHADVPSIPLEPNVYVTVIPYAFQRTEMSPEQLLAAWGRKVNRMSLYNYWSIPDWSHDLPTFNFLETPARQLRQWHQNGVEGFLCETTYSGGAMGPGWYLAGRLMWDLKADEQAILDEFYRLGFGPGAAPMRRMLERWALHFTLTTHELGLSFRDLAEALRLTEADPAARARVLDYGRYVQYLRLWLEYQRALGKPERHDRAQALLRHGWGIHHSTMIHAWRLFMLTVRDESKLHPEVLKLYKYAETADWWKAIQPVTDAEVARQVADGVQQFQPQEFAFQRYTGKLTPLAQPRPDPEAWSPVFTPSSTVVLEVEAPPGLSQLRLRVSSADTVRVTMTDAQDEVVATASLTAGAKWLEEWREFAAALPRPGRYRVTLWSPKKTFRMQAPAGLPMIMPSWTNSQGIPTPRFYFYVPKGQQVVAIHAGYTAAGPPRFFDPAGKEVKPRLEDGGKLLLLPIPAGQDGSIWSLSHVKAASVGLEMLNTPQAFSFFADTMLVPQDAMKK